MKINGYPLDASIKERLRYESEITDYAVEKGANPADHIRPKNPVLSFDGIVSDTPLGAIASDPTRTGLADGLSASRDAFARFVAIHEAKKPVIIECTFGVFEDMAMTSLSPERDSKSFRSFQFTAEFKKLKFVTNNRTTIRIAIPAGGAATKLGAGDGKRSLGQAIQVFTGKVSQRAQFTKGYGAPIAMGLTSAQGIVGDNVVQTIPRAPFDCYRCAVGHERNAEGYLTVNATGSAVYTYHEYASLYDPATNTRKDLEGRDITTVTQPTMRQPPPGGWWSQYGKGAKPQ